MIRAAAVLMYFPSPSGFLGSGVTGKSSSVRRGVEVIATGIVLKPADERTAAGEEKFPRPWAEFIRGGGILKLTPFLNSRFIRQPSGSFARLPIIRLDHQPRLGGQPVASPPSPTKRMEPDQRLDDLSQVGQLLSPLSPLITAPDYRLHPSFRPRCAHS